MKPKDFKERTADEIKSYVAVHLREAREKADLSQGEVARRLKMHRPTISEIEAGRRNVTIQELVMFARLYGVKIADLAGRE